MVPALSNIPHLDLLDAWGNNMADRGPRVLLPTAAKVLNGPF